MLKGMVDGKEALTIDTNQNPEELGGSKVGNNGSWERVNQWDGS
jgi:hypothetical protein